MGLTLLKLYLLTLMIIHFHCPITANNPLSLTHRTVILTYSTFPLKELKVLCKHTECGRTLNDDPKRVCSFSPHLIYVQANRLVLTCHLNL